MSDCYHFTNVENIPAIMAKGLVPSYGTNSALIGDTKKKVYFSEGFAGAISLYVDFELVYEQIKNGKHPISDITLIRKIKESSCLEYFLGKGVYFHFNKDGIFNERNFENGCTWISIPPDCLDIVILKNHNQNSIIYNRRDVILYMMAHTEPNSILYHGSNYPSAPDPSQATEHIREKVVKYYNRHTDEIRIYNSPDLSLFYIPIIDFKDIINQR